MRSIVLEPASAKKNEGDLEENFQVQDIAIDEIVDPNLVTWDGSNDPAHPQNWPLHKKWIVTFLISVLELITIGSSLMIAPALHVISADLHINNTASTQLAMSAYVLAFGVGPLFFGPLSELYGRKRIVQVSNIWYMVWNMACGFAKNEGTLVMGRLMAGAGASAMFAVGPGILSDCWAPEQRGLSMAIYSFLPLVGPAIGPIFGGFVTQKLSWHWVFWSSTLFDGLIQAMGIFFFRETHAPTILHRKAAALRKSTGNISLFTIYEKDKLSITAKMKTVFTRAIVILATQHHFQIITILIAWDFGVMYALHSTLASIFQVRYGESLEISGLNYLSMVIGFTLGAQVGGQLTDRLYAHIRRRQKGVAPRPEHRIPVLAPSVILIPAGLLLYGWSVQARLYWLVPNVGIVLFAFGTTLRAQGASSYAIDAAGDYAASAMAGVAMGRSLGGFAMPLVAPSLYKRLGWGGGNSLLAGLSMILGIVLQVLLWKFGEKLRKKGKLAERWK